MKVNKVRLHVKVWHDAVTVYDQEKGLVFSIRWGRLFYRTKPQAIALANRLCDRFNAGQEKK